MLKRDDLNIYVAEGKKHIFLDIEKKDIFLSFENLEKLFKYLDTLNIENYSDIKKEITKNYGVKNEN